ncbi:hypothetical protein BGX33_011760 [Mortierella sp. NVP41]|nr:hypothetical protein BGX33_011760 [Mortierella sp. NVP41]
MASPKRTQRNGQTKSKKTNNKVEDDGGQTRCVCEQEHHMGVMIQCETCKVWQHCPCVGLGDGLVTPDKYYCDSCRPENHPYHVVDGVLMTNAENTSSVVAALKVKSPKTKSSARESKVSADRNNRPDTTTTTATAIEHNQGNVTRASNRRKKTDSTLDDFDQTTTSHTNSSDNSNSSNTQTDDESETSVAPVTTTTKKKGAAADKEKSAGSAGGSTTTKNSTTGTKRKKGSSTALANNTTTTTARSTITTTMAIEPDQPMKESSPAAVDQDSESAGSSSTTAAPSTRRNGRLANTKKNSRAAPEDDVNETTHIVPASKRRRTVESTTRAKEESVPETEDDDKASDKDTSNYEAVVEAPATRSRRGHGTRANKKIDPIDNEQPESTTTSEETHEASEVTAKTDSIISQPEVKRGGAHRKAQLNHHGHYSRHGSPAGTPQPAQVMPVQPTKVKYPSAKMTFADMNKRAKQLFDYISHAQVEISEMKKNREAAAAAALERANRLAIASAATSEDVIMSDSASTSASSSDSQPAWLSTPPRSVHEPIRSESLDPMTQPTITTTTTAEQKQDATTQGGSRQGSGGQPPMTPPPQNEAESCNTHSNNMHDDGSKDTTMTPAEPAPLSCLEQMNKLKRDLIHFQEKFGPKYES